MERDCLIAHGAAAFMKEKFVDTSDLFTVNINRKTGLMAVGDPNNLTLRDDQIDCKQVRTSYAMKLLTQELMAIGKNIIEHSTCSVLH